MIRDYEVKEIVVGLPLRMSGAEGTQSEKMRAFAEDLRNKFRLPVHLWDERLTSAEANRFLRETDLSIEKRGKAVDRMAAVLILQGWMEQRAFCVELRALGLRRRGSDFRANVHYLACGTAGLLRGSDCVDQRIERPAEFR